MAGAIFRERRPATIIRSDWRGEPRKTSAPNRAMSYRLAAIAIISIAQQARPNCAGQIADRRAHCTSLSTVVVRSGSSGSSPCSWPCVCSRAFMKVLRSLARGGTRAARSPIEHALAPDVHEPHEQNQEKRHDLYESGPPEVAQRHSPRIEKRHLDVEQQEDHRHEIELH